MGTVEQQQVLYASVNASKKPDANVIMRYVPPKHCYALSFRFFFLNTGANRSFVSTVFSSLIDIVSTALDHDYDVELVDEKIIRVNTIIRACTLNFLNHTFNIDLMPVELGCFDVIIGMDWLVKYHAVIVYDEKIDHIPFQNEILIVRGDRSNNRHETNSPFQDFPEVFPEDLLGISPTRQVEFQIDLIPECCTCSTGALSISPIRDERIVGSTTVTFPDKGLYKDPVSPPWELRHVCQRRRWIIPDVH
ncbi:putative reverse transcriptase domain-containing protein [Tanacetum coccineum]